MSQSDTSFEVSEAESGQKILQCLQRRLDLPPSLLHRWLRTGQIRLNGGRCRPFVRVSHGDMIRIPPFAHKLSAQGDALPDNSSQLPLPPLLAEKDGILAFSKPAGLPTHAGSGHDDSLATRLISHYADADFRPAPAHRLDKDTSGILLVASSYMALRTLQEDFRHRRLCKEYVAWVNGQWPWAEDRLLSHMLHKDSRNGFEKMQLATQGGKEARCLVRLLHRRDDASLLHIRLFTGRTHQIRAQLALEGHAVLGDNKYGAPSRTARMYLHSLRITLSDGQSFACLPDWPAPYVLETLPPRLDLPEGIMY